MNSFRGTTAFCAIMVALLTVLCTGPASAQTTPADGVLSSHLVGTYDNNSAAYLTTVIQVVNPTSENLTIMAFFLDDRENLLKCVMRTLTPDDLEQLDVKALRVGAKVGVVKIVSVAPDSVTPKRGIVGYKRTFHRGILVSETVLHSVPFAVFEKLYPKYRGSCGK